MMNHLTERPSSDACSEQYVSEGGELSLTNLGQRELLLAMVEGGNALRTTARGFSMHPFIRDKDILTIAPVRDVALKIGDVVAFTQPLTGRLAIHRIVAKKEAGWLIRGDNCLDSDGIVPAEKIIGYVCRVERNGKNKNFGIGYAGMLIAILSRGNTLLRLRQIIILPGRVLNFGLRLFQLK